MYALSLLFISSGQLLVTIAVITCRQPLHTMIVPESHNEQLNPSIAVARGTSQQRQSNPSLYGSNGNISGVASSIQYEPQEYTETDYLLPVKLYGTSRSGSSTGTMAAGGPVAPAETVCSMVLQILVPFLLAGLGTVSAGMLLEVVQVRKQKKNWRQQKKCGIELRWPPFLVSRFARKLEMNRDKTGA